MNQNNIIVPYDYSGSKIHSIIQSNNNRLSCRENEIIGMLSKGLKRKEIANSLGLSPKTIDIYTDRLMRKTNVFNKVQLMKIINN